jgi:Uma2 family endonuclease
VVRGEPRFLDGRQDTLLNPTFLAQVLSPSEARDRGRKFEHYRSIESLQNYLMVASDRQHTDLYTYPPQPDRRWLLTPASRPEACIEIQSINCKLCIAELCEKVDRSETAPPAPLTWRAAPVGSPACAVSASSL